MGRYYDGDRMADVRRAFEEVVLAWPDVSTQVMFGCPAYQVRGKLFGFLVTEGLVLTRLDVATRHALERERDAGPFEAGQRTMDRWCRIPVTEPGDLASLAAHVEESFEAARAEAVAEAEGETG